MTKIKRVKYAQAKVREDLAMEWGPWGPGWGAHKTFISFLDFVFVPPRPPLFFSQWQV